MKLFLPFIFFLFSLLLSCTTKSNYKENNFVKIKSGETADAIVKIAASVTPSQRQLDWQEMELTAFIHFTVNTFTDREWGEGIEKETVFNPTNLDARQWVKTLKAAGFKLIIATAKHHDGFCLWPTKYTEHSVKNSPWKNGKGDVIQELSEACKEENIKFGIYLSPWDRHEKTYGDSPKYNEYFRNQLTELLTNYGEIYEVWFDGACGEGPNGKKQVYDFDSYYSLIRKLQPKAVISGMGPDVRWVGTETGYGRETEWSVIPVENLNQESIAEKSQKDVKFVPQNRMNDDLGSREKIKDASTLVWYPSETDVSIRPGWFYHSSEDDKVKSPEKLIDIYINSVGKNSVLLLNVPPDRRGLLHENDIAALMEWRKMLDMIFKDNIVKTAKLSASEESSDNGVNNIIDENKLTYWTTKATNEKAFIDLEFDEEKTFDILMLQENIRIGQRIEKFEFQIWENKEWKKIIEGTTVGYKRLLKFPKVTTTKARINILSSRLNPTILEIGLYKSFPIVDILKNNSIMKDSAKVEITCDEKEVKIFYTTDGTDPTEKATLYNKAFYVKQTCDVKAIAFKQDGVKSFVRNSNFVISDFDIKLNTEPSDKYNEGNLRCLIDKINGTSFDDGKWLGFEGCNADFTFDLKSTKNIKNINLSFLSSMKSWIFLPETIKIETSMDGKNYKQVSFIKNPIPSQIPEPSRKEFTNNYTNMKARYVHITAKNIGVCPNWHPGKNEKAWIFLDEITIN